MSSLVVLTASIFEISSGKTENSGEKRYFRDCFRRGNDAYRSNVCGGVA